MKKLAYDYSCLMAEIPDDVAQEIIAFADSIPDEYIYKPDDKEKGRAKYAHITVKFGIHTTDLADVEKVVAGLPLLTAKLGRVTAFNNEDFVVLKVSVQSEDLVKLNGKIKRELECTDTYPDYKPHITIAYLKKDEKNPYYYQDFCTNDFLDREIQIGNLTFSVPGGTKEKIILGGEVGRVAREVRIAARLAKGRMPDYVRLTYNAGNKSKTVWAQRLGQTSGRIKAYRVVDSGGEWGFQGKDYRLLLLDEDILSEKPARMSLTYGELETY